MDNRSHYSEDPQYTNHTNQYSHHSTPLLNSNNQMVHPQRDFQGNTYPQNPNSIGRPPMQNVAPPHHSSHNINPQGQGYYSQQSMPQNSGMQMSGHSSHSGHVGQSQPPPPMSTPHSMYQHYPPPSYSLNPSNYMHPGPPPSSNYGYNSTYFADDYQTSQSQPNYTAYPSAPVSVSGGYPPRNTTPASYGQPPVQTQSHDLSPPTHHAPPISSQPLPPVPVVTSLQGSGKPDNISEFKKKAEEMKESYLSNLENMINAVNKIKRDKDKSKQGHKHFDEIQKKLTLLKTLITADFKPNSNFPPRKEILEAAEKQIKMWIEEWGKLFSDQPATQSGHETGVPTQDPANPNPNPNVNVKREGSNQGSYGSHIMQDLGATANWPLSEQWPIELENLAFSIPIDTGDVYGSGTFFDLQQHEPTVSTTPTPTTKPKTQTQAKAPVNDIPSEQPGIVPTAILGKRREVGEDTLYNEDQPAPKYPKTN